MAMEYSNLLHTPVNKASTRFRAFLDGFLEVMEELRQTSEDYSAEYTITYSTILDTWGRDLDLPRIDNETNTSYRARLLDVMDGKGITKTDLKAMVDGILAARGYTACQIYEFYTDLDFDLDPYEFRIELPIQVKHGLFVKRCFVGFVSAIERSYKEPWIVSIENALEEMSIDEIKRVMNKFKASGTKFITTYGGDEV